MRRAVRAVWLLALLCCVGMANARAETLGDTLLRQLQRENAWLKDLQHDLMREVGSDEARLKNALKEKGKDKKGCRELVCKGRGDAAVLFARLNDALFRASLDAAVLARNYEDEADRVMRDIRFVKADMARTRSAMFWRNTFAGLADFAAQMAYALATGDATSLEGEMAVLAASSTEYAVNQQLNGLRGKAAEGAGKVAGLAGLPPDVVKSIVTDWSSVGLFDVSGGKITEFRPKSSVLDNPANAAGSVLVSRVVGGVINMGHRLWGGVDFAANYDEKQRMYGKMLREALALRVAAAFAGAQVKHLREVKHRFNELFAREAKVIAQCRREAKAASCEAAYRKALEEAARRREVARKAAGDAVAAKQRELARLQGLYVSTVERRRRQHNDYVDLRRRWHDARYWSKPENRRELEAYASCIQCKEHEKARREIAYYKSLPSAAELEAQVKAARKALLALGGRVARLEMDVDAAREAVGDARRESDSALFAAGQAYASTVREAERKLARCMDAPAPEMHGALGAKASVKRGKLAGFEDVMKPVHAAGNAIRRMFGKRAFDWRSADREECRPEALTFDFRPMEGVDGCWRSATEVDIEAGKSSWVLSVKNHGKHGVLYSASGLFQLEGGRAGNGRLQMVHRLTPASFKRRYQNATPDGAFSVGRMHCNWDMKTQTFPSHAYQPWEAVEDPDLVCEYEEKKALPDGRVVLRMRTKHLGINWRASYLLFVFDIEEKALMAMEEKAHIQTVTGVEVPPPLSVDSGMHDITYMTQDNIFRRYSAPVTKLQALNEQGAVVRSVQSGAKITIRAEGKSICPDVREHVILSRTLISRAGEQMITLVETGLDTGVFVSPENGLILVLPPGYRRAEVTLSVDWEDRFPMPVSEQIHQMEEMGNQLRKNMRLMVPVAPGAAPATQSDEPSPGVVDNNLNNHFLKLEIRAKE